MFLNLKIDRLQFVQKHAPFLLHSLDLGDQVRALNNIHI